MSIGPWYAFGAASAVLLIIPGPTTFTLLSYSKSRREVASARRIVSCLWQ